MVSAQVSSLIKLYRVTPDGNRTQLAQMRVEDSAPAGGASEGAGSAVSTPEKRIKINSPVVFVNDDILMATITVDGAATIDASDMIWSIPLVTPQGTKTLGRAQFANPTVTDIAFVAGIETDLGGYKIIEGQAQLRGTIYLDVQDNS
jgi:hypothetical protein